MSRTLATACVLFSLTLPLALAAFPKALQHDAGEAGDAGDASTDARPLVGPGAYDGELAFPADPEDWYALDVPAGRTLAATLRSTDGAVVELWSPSGARADASVALVLASDRVEVPAAEPGAWRVRVVATGPAQLPYRLVLSVEAPEDVRAAAVVVATFDTGVNPFHPCWRREVDLLALVPELAAAQPLTLDLRESYAASRAASQPSLAALQDHTLYHVEGTTLLYRGGQDARLGLVDAYPHGAMASSQIGCAAYGLAPNALVLALNWYQAPDRTALLRWAADQPFVDVIHLNVQDTPFPLSRVREVDHAVARGKLVVVAAGNGVRGEGVPYPSEVSRYAGPRGVLVVGANDNGGHASYSNLDPDVVMDGGQTLAAAPDGFGHARFGGTSSASARAAGYVARILGELRAEFGHTGAGLLTVPASAPRPTSGPLADGVLAASELHEAVRKTADPDGHESRYDGRTAFDRTPSPEGAPAYAKMGYGEVSERTMPHALDVLAGRAPMPERPVEDAHFRAGTTARGSVWR